MVDIDNYRTYSVNRRNTLMKNIFNIPAIRRRIISQGAPSIGVLY